MGSFPEPDLQSSYLNTPCIRVDEKGSVRGQYSARNQDVKIKQISCMRTAANAPPWRDPHFSSAKFLSFLETNSSFPHSLTLERVIKICSKEKKERGRRDGSLVPRLLRLASGQGCAHSLAAGGALLTPARHCSAPRPLLPLLCFLQSSWFLVGTTEFVGSFSLEARLNAEGFGSRRQQER